MIEAVLPEVSLKLSSIHWVKWTRRVLYILDLANFDPDVDAVETSCVKATDFCSSANIIVIAIVEFALVILLPGWKRRRQL